MYKIAVTLQKLLFFFFIFNFIYVLLMKLNDFSPWKIQIVLFKYHLVSSSIPSVSQSLGCSKKVMSLLFKNDIFFLYFTIHYSN